MTERYKFTGKAAWAKVYEADEFRGSKNWKINVYLDDKELDKRKKAGIQSKVYEDEEGKYVVFKRPETKLIKGSVRVFCGPEITDKDGKTLVTYKKNSEGTAFERVGDPVLIGNGSTVEVEVSVYPTSMGNGQRLESVRIVDLIEYKSEGGTEWEDSITVGSSSPEEIKKPW